MNGEQISKFILDRINSLSDTEKLSYLRGELEKISDPLLRSEVENIISLHIFKKFKPRPPTLVMAVHGIRTHGIWQDILDDRLKDSQNTLFERISFGYKDVLTFWFPLFTRKRSIKYVAEQLLSCIENSPNHTRVVVAHSFGTYAVSKFLKKNPAVHIDRIIFCGSIVNEKFPWEKMKNRPMAPIVNDCGTRDIWPVLAKSFSFDYGDSGTSGFTSHKSKSRYHDCGHDGFFTDEFMDKYWIPYITDGIYQVSEWNKNRKPKPWIWSIITLIPSGLAILLIGGLLYFFTAIF